MKTLIKTMVFLLAVTLATTARAGGQRTFTVNGVSFTMVAVDGGTFTMGTTVEQGSNPLDSDERPTHQVTLSDFMIGKTEVTQQLWTAVMGSNPSYFSSRNGYADNPQRPVEYVTWNDCQTFISKLNQLTGKVFRLPTEAEWEFAARGGNQSKGYKYAGSNNINEVAWYEENAKYAGGSDYGTHMVATKLPNELGLYDMSGNVWEWCQDYYGGYSSEAQTNPIGPSSGNRRVFRSGSWDFDSNSCRVAQRGGDDHSPTSTYSRVGLRLAMDNRGVTYTVNGVSFTMVAVDGGTFTMGATAEQGSNPLDSDERPTHQVTLSDFMIGKTEVTQQLWTAVMGSNPSYFSSRNGYADNPQRPVEYVTWNDCQTFISKLNQLTGKVFRLPTEAEWEFAARGGNQSKGYKYAGSNNINEVAWYEENAKYVGGSDYGTHMVATKLPNELGLYDMSGNVWEWCQDYYGGYSSEAQTNPIGPSSGNRRVFRSGSWDFDSNACRVAQRGGDDHSPTSTYSRVGLRLALTKTPNETGDIKATGLALDKSSLSLIVGSGATLNATIIPDNVSNKTLNWTSSDPNIASVDANGNVVANDEGTAIITVSTTDGSDLSASCTVVCQYGDTRTVLIGTGGATSEGAPICNWWMTDYQGNESLYLRDELKMKKGDIITSLSYHCVGGSAGGGLFNVRIINTSLNELCGTDHDIYNNDPSILKVKYEDTVYGTVQLGGYSSGDWVTFNLSKPFVYDGENIIVDIRNVEKGSRSGWVYFETTPGIEHRTFVWLHALDEAVTGFNSSDCVHNDNNLLNVLITYAPNKVDYVYASELSLNKTESFLAVNGTEQLVATIEPENVTTKTLQWTSSNPTVATVDGTGTVRALNRGTAVITATTTDGSELSASCTVVVTSIYALLTDTLTHVRGDAATVVDLPIVMVNKNDIAGLQFELSLPDGVSMVMTNGVPAVTLDDNRKSRDHSVFASRLSNGNYRVLVSSPTNKKLKGNNGVVLHLNLELAQYHNSGDKTLRFSNINLVEPDETQHAIDDFTSIARLCYVLGDADADMQVDAGDYMATVLSIMEQPVVHFYSDAADVNNDSGINITDLIGITNIALGIRSAEVKHAPAVGRVVEPSVSLTPADDRAACDIVLHNSLPMAGMQFDVTLPEGMRIEGAEALRRATGWQVATADLCNGKTRVLMSHFGDKNITAGDDAVIRLSLTGTARGDGECEITGIAIAQRDLTTFHPSPFKIAVTGIDDLLVNGNVSIYAQGGNVIIESGEAGEAQLVMLNGMTRPLHVSAGRNVYPINNSGVYVVRFNGVTAKLQL